jgi:hypothetical protein
MNIQRMKNLSIIRTKHMSLLRKNLLGRWKNLAKQRRNRKILKKSRDPSDFYNKKLKKQYFNRLKQMNCIYQEVKRLNTVILETRRFYLQKSFFNPWKNLTKARRQLLEKFRIQQKRSSDRLVSQYLFVWVHASVLSYQVSNPLSPS